MIRSLAVLMVLLLACCAADAQQTNVQIRFRALVQAVVPLSRFSGTVVPVHPDPRFALSLRIESATSGNPDFAKDSGVIFAIHSPTQLFAGEDPKGKTYEFKVRRSSEKGKVRYNGLDVLKKP